MQTAVFGGFLVFSTLASTHFLCYNLGRISFPSKTIKGAIGMNAKRAWFLGALAAIMILLPAIGVAESWADFVQTVNAATKKAKGEVIVTAPDIVERNVKGDAELFVPKGVQLVIEGGSFEVMLLGGGDITLRGVTVQNPEGNRAILIWSDGKKAVDLALTIEEDTVIAAENGTAIQWAYDYTKSPDVKIYIDNRGTITAGMEIPKIGFKPRGIEIVHRITKTKKADITVRNSGTISGGIGIEVGIDNQGLSTANVINEGTIHATAGGIAVSVQSVNKKSSASVENAATGKVTATAEDSYGISLGVLSELFKKKVALPGQVVNEGTAIGGRTGISMGSAYFPTMPVTFTGSGIARCTETAEVSARDIDIDFYMTGKDKAPDQDTFEQTIEQWLDENDSMGGLPEGTRVRVQLAVASSEGAGPLVMEKTR